MSPVTFTDTAVQHIKHMLEKNTQSIGFRLTVKKTGCSGLAYVSAIIEQPVENDIHFTAQNDLPVFIDPAALEFIQDLQVDYVESAAQGLKQKRLVFMNPKETGRCGCGESFTIE